jgi:hypothetical protein
MHACCTIELTNLTKRDGRNEMRNFTFQEPCWEVKTHDRYQDISR